MADIKQWEVTEKDLKERYQEEFDPDVYNKSLYDRPTSNQHSADFMKAMISSFHRIFSIELPEGETVLDLGCGPTIHAVISASYRYKSIVSADFLDKNRQKVQKWIRNEEPLTFDWSYVFQTVASLEKETDYTKLEARLRSRIKEVIPCDVTVANPLAPLKRTFDVVVTSCCYEAIATDDASYKKIVANTANLLAPNGHLVVAGVLNCSYYVAGRKGSFYSFSLRKELVEEAMKEAGLEILVWQIQPKHQLDPYESDISDTFVVLAKKK